MLLVMIGKQGSTGRRLEMLNIRMLIGSTLVMSLGRSFGLTEMVGEYLSRTVVGLWTSIAACMLGTTSKAVSAASMTAPQTGSYLQGFSEDATSVVDQSRRCKQ